MRTLDKSRPYSTVYGDSAAVFYQEGRYFNASGDEVSEEAAAKRNPGGASLPLAEPIEKPADVPQPSEEELAKERAAIAEAEAAAAAAPADVPVLTEAIAPEGNGVGFAQAQSEGLIPPEATTETTFGTDANGAPVEG